MAEVKQYGEGEIVFEEKAYCDGVYIVTNGLVEIFTKAGENEMVLTEVGKGGMFGEMATIDLQERSAGARAMEPTTVVHLGRNEFGGRLQKLPLWALLLIQMLVRRLRESNLKLVELQTNESVEPVEEPRDEDRLVADERVDADQIMSEMGRELSE